MAKKSVDGTVDVVEEATVAEPELELAVCECSADARHRGDEKRKLEAIKEELRRAGCAV